MPREKSLSDYVKMCAGCRVQGARCTVQGTVATAEHSDSEDRRLVELRSRPNVKERHEDSTPETY